MKKLLTCVLIAMMVVPVPALADDEPPGKQELVLEGEATPFTGLLLNVDRAEWFAQLIVERDDLRGQLPICLIERDQLRESYAVCEAARADANKWHRQPGVAFGGGLAVGAGVVLAVVLAVTFGGQKKGD